MEKNKENQFPIVEVHWADAQSSMDAIHIDDLKKEKMALTKSCGYLVQEDKEKVILCFMDFYEGQIKHWQMIPKGMIKKITKIKEANL